MEIFLGLSLLFIVAFYLGYISGKNKARESLKEELFRIDYEGKIHPLVKDIYNLYISENGLQHFIEYGDTIIKIPILGVFLHKLYFVSIFRDLCKEDLLYKQYGQTVEEINDSLSSTDKAILDKIMDTVHRENREFLNRVFIKD